ncbi:protein SAMBA isoform X3 [Coffea eugenioides]|uniref:Protein SAMBA-like isoform X3 n=1 Tax=Coffea arabica TaxID=13443 RepID=A0A6P6TSX4_COFAR|nr:protein SAMBA-like isoform X3 [Coffea arabica]XP_027181647.1 protein SAMBA isoform X3 [Coffea eugenioides]
MSNSSLSSSPARSSISTTAVAGSANAVVGGSSLSVEDYHFPADLISIQDRKDEALLVLKADLMAALNKEVKSLDEDSWMFEGPRSRINLISRPGSVTEFGCVKCLVTS